MKKIVALVKNATIVKRILSVLLVALTIGLTYFILVTTGRVSIENSLVSAPITTLSPAVPGKIKEILVSDGQKVNKGDAVAVVGTEIVRAYTDGIVVATDRGLGSIASPQTPVVQVVDPSQMRIDGTIDENKGLNRIKPGQAASFTVDALPGQTFWGYVDEVAQTAKQTQMSFSISSERPTQQFDVYARFDAARFPQIKNGMSAKMTVYTVTPR